MTSSDKIQDMLSKYMEQKSIFVNKDALTISFKPDDLPHREEQIGQVIDVLAPALRGDRPSSLFLYGKSGTGKSVVSQYVARELEKASKKNSNDLKIIYINCKMRRVADTEYRLLAELSRQLGKDVPETGLPTNVVYKTFFETLDEENRLVLLILDEIDTLVKKIGDGILYSLIRVNEELEQSKLSIVGISNDLSFSDSLDARVKSSLSEEELIFPPYNAIQLKDILKDRSEVAFTIGAVDDSVVSKCAALAAQEHGDARKALDLLRVSGEIADRLNDMKVTEKHVDLAEDKIDVDRVIEVIKTQPKQSQAVLWSIIKLVEDDDMNVIETGDIFDMYSSVCKNSGLGCLTQRRVSDLIAELDSFGIINAKVVSKGRYGRTREVKLAISDQALRKVKEMFTNSFYFE